VVNGKYQHDEDDRRLRIYELPIKKWTRDYKKFLETLLEKDVIVDLREYHSTNQVDFEIFYEKREGYFDDHETIMKQFKLTTTLSDNNYVLFDKENKLRRYADETEILDEFYEVRLDLYYKRKNYMIRKLERDLEILENKARFITEVISGTIVVNNKKKKELLKILREQKYAKYSDIIAKVPEENAQQSEIKLSDNEEDEEIKDEDDEEIIDLATDYNYLLNQAIWSLTKERIEALLKEKQIKEDEIVALQKVCESDLWREDLDEISKQLNAIETKELDLMEKTKQKMDKERNKKKPKIKRKKVSESIEKTKPAAKKAPKKERTSKKKTIEVKPSKGIKALIKNKAADTSASERSMELNSKNIEDLPLVERMKLKKQMRDNEEKKGSFQPDLEVQNVSKGYSKKKLEYSEDVSSGDEGPVKSIIGTRTKGGTKPNYAEDIEVIEDSESSFDI